MMGRCRGVLERSTKLLQVRLCAGLLASCGAVSRLNGLCVQGVAGESRVIPGLGSCAVGRRQMLIDEWLSDGCHLPVLAITGAELLSLASRLLAPLWLGCFADCLKCLALLAQPAGCRPLVP